jgi:hypothetical protein
MTIIIVFSKIDEGLILSYAFYGGVVASSTTLSFQPLNLIPTALCMISTAIWGNHINHIYTHYSMLITISLLIYRS